ncbi:hypothetical protein FJU08_10125 [Martelella alba]|uniref:Uncharacterized protein n=1 Tax=Martelella alba TaxID=2590451 RepID=A0A506UDV0_9HYPH|nr:hypothetical protein [Martelella alba]TPW31005.1 hypothetical protein FJU08_10125 [Martelella alba]
MIVIIWLQIATASCRDQKISALCVRFVARGFAPGEAFRQPVLLHVVTLGKVARILGQAVHGKSVAGPTLTVFAMAGVNEHRPSMHAKTNAAAKAAALENRSLHVFLPLGLVIR